MILNLKPDSFFVFDLDDTLYPEIEFLQSGYRQIAKLLLPVTGQNIYPKILKLYGRKENVFEWIVSSYSAYDKNITIEKLLKLYREHEPTIKLNNATKRLLDELQKKNIPAGLITDGRSTTQRNKLKSLGLSHYFRDIVISEEFGSEKPDQRNYFYFQHKYQDKNFYFIGDNTSKDFIIPLKLGWFTICLRNNGRNIHPQNFKNGMSPNLIIDSFSELNLV